MSDKISREALNTHKAKLNGKIISCLNCQPRDDGEFVWVLGDEVSLRDVFRSLKIPEECWQSLVEDYHCPNCGSFFEDPSDSVGLDDEKKNKNTGLKFQR